MYGAVPIYEYKIDYKLAPVDIKVEGAEDSAYRIELTQIDDTSTQYYNASILSSSNDQMLVTYRSRLETGVITEVNEYTVPNLLFTETSEEVRGNSSTSDDIMARRIFSLVDTAVYVTESNVEHLFSYKPRWPAQCRIMVKKPYLGDFTSDWNIRVSAGEVTTVTNSYIVTAPVSTINIVEKARILGNKTISVSGSDLIVSVDENGEWIGVTVVRDSTGTEIAVEFIDAKSGVIHLSSAISRREVISVYYSISTNDLVLDYPCFNPMDAHANHNEGAGETAAIICIIDSRYVPAGRTHPIYVKFMDMILKNIPLVYSYEEIDDLINSSSASIRNTFRTGMGLPTSLLGTDRVRIEPLAIVQVLNVLDSDAYDITDMRVYGGGYRDKHYSFHDYSLYDGENADLESMLVVEVPEWIKDDLKERAKLWDVSVTKSDADEISSHADAKAMEIIREKVKKYSMLGTTQEIVIGTKTITDNS